MTALLRVKALKKHFPIRSGVFKRQTGVVRAVDGVDLSLEAGQTLGLVGESGCGKTTVGRCIVRLYRPTAGSVAFQGRDLAGVKGRELRKVRRDIQMIFQDPYESLNSRHTVGTLLEEPFAIHHIGTSGQRRKKVDELLERVGLPLRAANRFPHEFSGGQRQRIGIARSIALNPKLIICDEPVSALDVSIQAQAVNLLLRLQKELGLAYLFIAHDLAVIKHVSDWVAVMYLGKIVEYARAKEIYRRPVHPYTRALIAAIPVADPSRVTSRMVLTGEVPSPIHPPAGCHFHPRCPFVAERCKKERPVLRPAPGSADPSHLQACLRAHEIEAASV